jgi:hypothetical protein
MSERKRIIKAIFVFEILGRPPEHIKEILDKHISKIEEIKEVKIISKKINEPKECEKEDAKGLYTTFAEVETECEDIMNLFQISLTLLPSHIEVIEPENIEIRNFDLNTALSYLATKLHKYDEVAKVLLIEREQFQGKIKELEICLKTKNKIKDNSESLKQKNKTEKKRKIIKKKTKKK